MVLLCNVRHLEDKYCWKYLDKYGWKYLDKCMCCIFKKNIVRNILEKYLCKYLDKYSQKYLYKYAWQDFENNWTLEDV